ncbi:hypothetical protein A8L34_28120 [Bacillus sp. FJAT-27264]|uniref:hypothetical protein n=1 Tax=Paenibacillus sp. (strain DSM 101736 / FJAT-27264) TaxID=1850362 RepID=UPI000807FF7F|nr:hypothetical protein [Bacillus sp. FJAT-27264]OBZ15915.1 hypothetical protein A8L34_28120 [Bacillus sp. FJAT-27264]
MDNDGFLQDAIGKSYEEYLSEFQKFIEPLISEAKEKKLFLHNTHFGDWKSPDQLFNNPTMFDMGGRHFWELKPIENEIHDLKETRDEYSKRINELEELLKQSYFKGEAKNE